ncbi:PTS sugar transporter subunit IIB [Aquibacillus saliphilus]|uniref:PTS sugar transporter subunit IIB n=1 Tax=Aquibacillus saliphilus TaxID=1909422 RepID=UPI001CEFF44B|nr:PTS sugar transporter subunit IIB [Aquibacillus saliphilus]
MKRILLACSAGMSTSLLVTKMKEAAEAKGIDVEIWAVAQDKAPKDMERADVLLIGPQMRFMKKKFGVTAAEVGIPLDVIDPMAYGRVDGEAVLNKAIELIDGK